MNDRPFDNYLFIYHFPKPGGGGGMEHAYSTAIDASSSDGQERLGQMLRGAVQRVGLVRYDAFEDVGGRLSFSCAMLNDEGDGVVMTSINGRQDTRVYAKPVYRGESMHNLSEEEAAAIREAMLGPRQTVEAR